MTIKTYSSYRDANGKTIPTTTEGACERYGATVHGCTCTDHAKRKGGSYICPRRRKPICKHIYRRRCQSLIKARVNAAAKATQAKSKPSPDQVIPRFAYLEIA